MKLDELQIPFNVAELIVDFEINIHKSIDEMMPGVDILGCFFHLAKAFKKKMDKKNMKKHYEENPEFRKFIKQSVGLSSLPLGDLEIGVKWLRDNVNFEDEEEASFKDYFMEYIESYWVNEFSHHLSGAFGNALEITQIIIKRVSIARLIGN